MVNERKVVNDMFKLGNRVLIRGSEDTTREKVDCIGFMGIVREIKKDQNGNKMYRLQNEPVYLWYESELERVKGTYIEELDSIRERVDKDLKGQDKEPTGQDKEPTGQDKEPTGYKHDLLWFGSMYSPENEKQELHQKISKFLFKVYKQKNNDYGDSFGKTYQEIGILSSVTRMVDKMNRIISLTSGTTQRVNDENLKDTIEDLANYSIMLLIELSLDDRERTE